MFDIINVEEVSKKEILGLAAKTEFMKRKPRKIDPCNFLNMVCTLSVLDTPSFNSIAAGYSVNYSVLASKQAISKKIKDECIDFFKSILALIIKRKLDENETSTTTLFLNKYKRVIVQDSTIIKLPQRLFTSFSGVKNAYTSVCNARIQGVYDLVSGKFLSFSIDPYYKNDVLAAPQLELCKDDLTLRDRGYFNLDELQRHSDAEADCIYRYRTKTTLIDSQTGKTINLYKLLKKKGCIDMMVCLNNDKHTKVRLIAAPVNEEIANKRKAKAKKEIKGHNPSKEVLELMSWTIFITTIPEEEASFDKILKLYSLRWRIEIVFKAWKSHAAFGKIHNVSEIQLRILLIARLIMVVVFTHYVYYPWAIIIRSKYKHEISLLKLFRFITNNLEHVELFIYGECPKNRDVAEINLLKYCTYDKRVRLNFNQIYLGILLS